MIARGCGRLLAGMLASGLVLAGCSSGGPRGTAPSGPPAVYAPGYWSQDRLLQAQAEYPGDSVQWLPPSPSSTPSARRNARTLRVGALFESSHNGNHFCTASVVTSPRHNLIVTAAHCLNPGNGGADNTNVTFVPAYANGRTPFGEWQPSEIFIDPRWVSNHDNALDVAFVTLQAHDGKDIEQVLGANAIEFNPGYVNQVRVTGYPSSADAPITCVNWTSKQSATAVRFACAHYYGGTSGSPWVTRFDPQTRTGTIVGILGGYQEGGDTPDVSYSSYLGDDARKLYEEAIKSKN